MGYAPNYASRYTDMQVASADRLELVLLLYKGAVKEAKLAVRSFGEGDIESRVNHLNKCSAMVAELRSALDFERGGEIARSLDRLYDFITWRLSQANAKQKPAMVEEVIQLLEILLSAWEEVRTKSTESEAPGVQSEGGGYPQDRLNVQSYSGRSGLSVSF